MKPEYKIYVVERNLDCLCRDMNPISVLSRLMKSKIFKQYDSERVNHEVTTQEKTMLIMETLMEMDFSVLSKFLSILASIDSTHYDLARTIQPVENHIAWFTPSPAHAAAVVYTLEKYAGAKFSKMARCGEGKSLVVRRGRVFPREFEENRERVFGDLPVVDTEKMVMQSHRNEVSLVFPTAGSDVPSALENWFGAGLVGNAKLILMSGVSRWEGAGRRMAVIATGVSGSVAGGERACAGVSDDEVKSLERHLSHTITEDTEDWVEEEGSSCDGGKPEVGFVDLPQQPPNGESEGDPVHGDSEHVMSTADCPAFKFYDLCKRKCPDQRSLLCQGVIPDPAHCRTIAGSESTAAIACSCVLMEVCKFYLQTVFL